MDKDIVENRKAGFEYKLAKKYEAGISLTAPEFKAVMAGHVSLVGTWVDIQGGEAFLVGVEGARPQKLLLHKEEIKRLTGVVQETGTTLIPTRMYMKNNRVKLEFCEATGKKQYDKRQAVKERDSERESARVLKHRA